MLGSNFFKAFKNNKILQLSDEECFVKLLSKLHTSVPPKIFAHGFGYVSVSRYAVTQKRVWIAIKLSVLPIFLKMPSTACRLHAFGHGLIFRSVTVQKSLDNTLDS